MVTVDLMVTEATEATGMAMDIIITDIMDIAMGNYYSDDFISYWVTQILKENLLVFLLFLISYVQRLRVWQIKSISIVLHIPANFDKLSSILTHLNSSKYENYAWASHLINIIIIFFANQCNHSTDPNLALMNTFLQSFGFQ